MSDSSSILDQSLNLGIAAARAGRNDEAQRYLRAVLKQDSQNIPAMFWLAFVLPSPHDSIRLLEQVLVLDPGNERAKAGICWAQKRLKPAAVKLNSGQTLPSPAQPHPTVQTPAIRRKPLPGKTVPTPMPRPTKQRAIAPRKRRLFTHPVATTILLTGVISLLAIVLGILVFGPVDTLAAWWPVSGQRPVQPASAVPEVTFVEPPVVDNDDTVVVSNRLAFGADTLRLEEQETASSEMTEVATTPESSQPLTTEEGADVATEAPNTNAEIESDANVTLAEPPVLLGPELSSSEPQPVENLSSESQPAADLPNEPQPVENLLLAYQPTHPNEKWIEINVTTQQITAWEGTTPVFSFIGSTGLPNTPTVLGQFNIYWKLESTLMTGPGYYLPEVPYTMYFYGGYALHGTYWHNNFGQPMSHGCVNLETGNAKQLFEWADPVIPPGQTQVVATANNPGTLVVVRQ